MNDARRQRECSDAAVDPSANLPVSPGQTPPVLSAHTAAVSSPGPRTTSDMHVTLQPPHTYTHGVQVRLLTPLVWGSPWITARPDWSHISLNPDGSVGASEGGFYCRGPLWQPCSTGSPCPLQARYSPPADLRLVHEPRLTVHEWRGNSNYTERS